MLKGIRSNPPLACYLLLLFILTAEASYASLPGGEVVSATNCIINGLHFSVSSVQQVDFLVVEIAVTQTNGGVGELNKLRGTASYERRLSAPLAATNNTNSLGFRVWIAPQELRNVSVEIYGPSPDPSDQPPIFAYAIDLESFLKERGSNGAPTGTSR